MTAQLLDYPTTPRVRVAPARRPGVTVSPHRDAPRRPLGPGRRSWSTTVGVAAHAGSVQGSGAGVGGTAVDLEHLHWTPRALMLMVVAVVALAVAMGVTIVSAFLAVSDAPVQPAAPVVAMSATDSLG